MVATTDFRISGYEIQRPIAVGGMSEVFLAIRLEDARQVVIKTATSAADEQTRERLIREHALLQTIDHPNIAKTLGCGCEDDRPYLVLEYVQGSSLRDRLRPGQPLAWQQASHVLMQLADALAALHDHRILHRDVKPENVLIDPAENIKLIDLSIGTHLRDLGYLTRQDQFLGTVDYMAPEQRHGIDIDERTDQYSLAAVTFEMLTGHCSLGQFRRPSELNPDLNEAMDRAVLQGLERDPEDRFDCVSSFARAVLAAGTKQPKQKPLRSLVISAAAMLLMAIGCLIGYQFTHESGSQPSRLAVPVSNPPDDKDLPVITNSLGMQFVQIPPGTFRMGTTREELDRLFSHRPPPPYLHETPAHAVTLTQPFWMGMHEVTVKQFGIFVGEKNYQTTSEKWIARYGGAPVQPIWNEPARYPSGEDLPVCAVSWEDATEFCRWLSEREGVTYRLPTEAEWEYACRAGTPSPWYCQEHELHSTAVFDRPWNQGPDRIGSRLPNRWGLHDMHGNVMEWCQDYYSTGFYGNSPAIDPICTQPSASGELRVLRGGGYKANSRAVRSTIRRGHESDEACRDRGHAIGFRVVMDDSSPRVAIRSD